MEKSRVKIIEPIVNIFKNEEGTIEKVKRRTCGYARVSTDDEDQKTSYDAQIDEYTKKIQKNKDWEFIGVFADEGISGTSLKKRDDFNRMIDLAKCGKIDLIITKSIARFARNTELTLRTVRELKEIGVEVYFEKENLWTFDPKVELFLTIFSSIAQEEVRNTSENVTWSLRKKMREGKPLVNHKRFLGYWKDEETGNLVVLPEEAKIVKMIFEMYTTGVSPRQIIRTLNEMGVKTGAGKSTWGQSSLTSILKNEKYVGDLLLQKTYTSDYLSHKRLKNQGKLPKYLIENNHEAIIDRNTFELAQKIREERRHHTIGDDKNVAKYNNRYPLTQMIVCYKCGKTLKRHYWNYGYPSQCVVRMCGNYFEGRANCDSKAIKDLLIQKACLDVINNLFLEESDLLDRMRTITIETIKASKVERKLFEANEQKESLEKDLAEIINMKLKNRESEQTVLNEKYIEISNKLHEVNDEIKKLTDENLRDFTGLKRIEKINDFIRNYKSEVTELDTPTLHTFISKIIAVDKTNIVICVHGNGKSEHSYFVENRTDIIKMDSVYEGTATLEQFTDVLHYKVVII